MSSHAYLLDNLITPPLALRSRTLSSTLPYTCYSGPMSHPRPSSPPALPSPLCLAYHHPSAYLATNPPPLQGPPTSRLRVCELSLTLLPLPSLAFPFPRPHPLLSKERRVTYISQWISPISVTFHTQSQCIEIWEKNHHIRLYIRSLPLMDYFHE